MGRSQPSFPAFLVLRVTLFLSGFLTTMAQCTSGGNAILFVLKVSDKRSTSPVQYSGFVFSETACASMASKMAATAFNLMRIRSNNTLICEVLDNSEGSLEDAQDFRYYTLPIPSDYMCVNSAYYKLYTEDKDFETARSICQSDGADVTDLINADDAQAIVNLWKNNAGPSYASRAFYIGYHKQSAQDSFKSVIDGTEYPGKWGQGQPDNPPQEFCVTMEPRTAEVSDVSCSLQNPFICKFVQ